MYNNYKSANYNIINKYYESVNLTIVAITAHQKFATLMRAFVYSNAESFITAALLFPLLYLWGVNLSPSCSLKEQSA